MLSDLSFSMMAEAKDFENSFSMLSDNRSYAETIGHLESAFDSSKLLELESAKTIALMDELCPSEPEAAAIKERHIRKMPAAEYASLLLRAAAGSESAIFKKYAGAYSFFSGIKRLLMDEAKSPESIIAETRYSDHGAAVARGLEDHKKTGSLSVLEKEEDNFLIGTLRPAKYKSFGIDPLIGFFIARETEIKNLRTIFTAKQLNVPAEDIKRRLRLSYV